METVTIPGKKRTFESVVIEKLYFDRHICGRNRAFLLRPTQNARKNAAENDIPNNAGGVRKRYTQNDIAQNR